MTNNELIKFNNNVSEIQPESEIQISKFFGRAFFHWPLYVIVTLLAIASGFIYLRYTKPVFVSVAKIYIKDENKVGSSRQSAFDAFDLSGSSKLVENEMEVIKSPIILNDVIRENGFNIRYFEKGQFSEFEVYDKRAVEVKILSDSVEVGNYFFDITRKNDQEIEVKYKDATKREHVIETRFNQPLQVGKDRFAFIYYPKKNEKNIVGFQVQIDSISQLAYVKANELTTTLVNNKASVFYMIYEDGVASRAADFLNSVAKKYNEYTLNDKNLTALNSLKFIDSRLQSLGTELGNIEKDVEVFKTSRGITQLDESSQLFLDQVKTADQKLDEANIQLSVLDQVEKYLNNNDQSVPFTPVIGNVDASLTSLINHYQQLLTEKNKISLSVQPDNPLQQNIEKQIDDTRNSIKNYIRGYRQNALTQKRGLQKKVNEIESSIARVPKYEREFINLKRQQSVKEFLYLYLLQKKEETAISYASNIVGNRVISPAYIPLTPVKPRKAVVMVAFVLAGLVITTLYILIKYMLNKRVASKKEIEKIMGTPVIAEIFRQDVAETGKFFSGNQRSLLSEQMLNLRSNLKFLLNEVTGTPVILFTSSISGEGKTFLSAHLGKVMTGNEKRVVLIELDLRKPKLAKSLGINNKSGLTNYLVGVETLDEVIKPVPDANNLFLIPSGPVPPNPVELIESEKMKQLFEILKQRFDYVIVDTAPAGLVSDAKSLTPYVDCTMFVVRFNYTPKAKLMEVSSNMVGSPLKKIGLIFNGIEEGSSYGYYNYGYSSYGNGYGYFANGSSRALSTFVKNIKQRLI